MQTFEQLAASNDEHTSESLADEFIRNFMQQEPIPGIAYENGLVQRFLPEITLADVNSLASDWVPDRNRVVVVERAEEAGVAAARRGEAGGRDQERRRRGADGLRRHGEHAAAARGAAQAGHDREDGRRRRRPAITEWTLSNGVRVVLKPTTFKQDEILFRAFSPGGTSLASDQDFVAAETADQVVAQGGLGTSQRRSI